MVRVTEVMIRSRAEHNEGILGTLEELSMHMLHIEKIEHFDKLCKKLKILLLQNNIVSKIENVSGLKSLEYLNLTLNILEKVEGLEGCESLEKLDLTINFIWDLLSVKSLQVNYNLKTLTLAGNPCTNYKGYRLFVIHHLPQLECLDGAAVLQTEKIQARQEIEKRGLQDKIRQQQNQYSIEWQKRDKIKSLDEFLAEAGDEDEEEVLRRLWSEKGKDTPEMRKLMAELNERQSKTSNTANEPERKKDRPLFRKSGKPLNINDSNLKFEFTENSSNNCQILKIFLPKSLDTSDMEVDVQPWYIKVHNKRGLLFQMTLLEEVCPDKSTAERSMATGNLVITAPFISEMLTSKKQNYIERFKNMELSNKNAVKTVPQMLETESIMDNNFDLSEVPQLEEVGE